MTCVRDIKFTDKLRREEICTSYYHEQAGREGGREGYFVDYTWCFACRIIKIGFDHYTVAASNSERITFTGYLLAV